MTIERYRGIKTFWEIYDGQWRCEVEPIRRPFYKDGTFYFSLNDKLMEQATKRKAYLSIKVGNRDISMRPTPKMLKQKRKEGLVEKVPSKFEDGLEWERYLFIIK